jgi:sigma-B regulation protein RsbU (phosphoserine phosphatase)
VNRHLVRETQRLPGLFVTGFYGIYDSRDGSIRYACAGHNPPLLVDRQIRVRELDHAQTLPLAIHAETDFPEAVEWLSSGDTLLLYTDGITEAVNAAGEAYGRERLLSCIREDVPNAQHIVGCVTGKLQAFTGGRPALDDQTLVAIRAGLGGRA